MKIRYAVTLIMLAAILAGWIAPDAHAATFSPFYADTRPTSVAKEMNDQTYFRGVADLRSKAKSRKTR